MNTKDSKLIKLEEAITDLGLTGKEVINHLNAKMRRIHKEDISMIKPGMYWLEDDTFSREKIAGIKVKAVVELVTSNGVICGDLTASEIFNINETKKWFLEKISNINKPFARLTKNSRQNSN